MKTATFKKYKRGLFTFAFDQGHDIDFEEVHPKILSKYDLINNKSLRNKPFKLSFSEVYDNRDSESVTYRIESLMLLN
ncbi:MAG: hypothetical protein ACWA5P_02750 [bacterium]